MKKKIDASLKKEREIQLLIDKIETMDHTLDGMNELSARLLNELLNFYYIHDFNGATLDEEHGLLSFEEKEKLSNVTRVIRLLKRFNGVNEQNEYIVNIVLKVVAKLVKTDDIISSRIYELTHRNRDEQSIKKI